MLCDRCDNRARDLMGNLSYLGVKVLSWPWMHCHHGESRIGPMDTVVIGNCELCSRLSHGAGLFYYSCHVANGISSSRSCTYCPECGRKLDAKA